jgi:hypothetical protein
VFEGFLASSVTVKSNAEASISSFLFLSLYFFSVSVFSASAFLSSLTVSASGFLA